MSVAAAVRFFLEEHLFQYSRDEFRSSAVQGWVVLSHKFHPKAIIIILRVELQQLKIASSKKVVYTVWMPVKLINSTVQFSFGPSSSRGTQKNATENETLMMTRKFH